MKKLNKIFLPLIVVASSAIVVSTPLLFNNVSNKTQNSNNQVQLKSSSVVQKTNIDINSKESYIKDLGINDLVTFANEYNNDPNVVNVKKLTLLPKIGTVFAQEIVTNQQNEELIKVSQQFNDELTLLINYKPSNFFREVVAPAQNPENLPYVKANTKLFVKTDGENVKIKVTVQYLTVNDITSKLEYSDEYFKVHGFNTGKTINIDNKADIKGYTYKKEDGTIINPSTMGPYEFINSEVFNAKLVLVDFLKENITKLFSNTIAITEPVLTGDMKIDAAGNINLEYKIRNYVTEGGNIIYGESGNDANGGKPFVVTISGFYLKPIPSEDRTKFKSKTIEEVKTIANNSSVNVNVDILANLDKYYLEELIKPGYLWDDILTSVTSLIMQNPEKWLDGYPGSSTNYPNENPNKLPLIEISNENNVSYRGKSLVITLKVLCRSQYSNIPVSEGNYDYLELVINPGAQVDNSFGSRAPKDGTTSFITNNSSVDINNKVVNNTSRQIVKFKTIPNNEWDSWYAEYKKRNETGDDNSTGNNGDISTKAPKQLTQYSLEEVENLFKSKNGKKELVESLNAFIGYYKNELFFNVLWTSDVISDPLSSLRFQNDSLIYKFKLKNYYKSGNLIQESTSEDFELTINGFSKPEDNTLTIIIACSVIGGTVLVAVVALLVYFIVRKKSRESADFNFEKTYNNWKS